MSPCSSASLDKVASLYAEHDQARITAPVMEPGVWYVLREAAPTDLLNVVIRGSDSSASSNSPSVTSVPLNQESWEAVEPATRLFCDLCRRYHVQPSGFTCLICGCSFEDHILSMEHLKQLSRKLEAHAREAIPREAFWQEIHAPGSYVVRFNHVDFEVQLCCGDPPPPHIPPKPGGDLASMLCQAEKAPESNLESDLQGPEVSMSTWVMAAVDELIESGQCEQLLKARPLPAVTPLPKREETNVEVPLPGQSPTKQLASSSTDSTGLLQGSPNDLVATEACMPRFPTLPAMQKGDTQCSDPADLYTLTAKPFPLVVPPQLEKASTAAVPMSPKEASRAEKGAQGKSSSLTVYTPPGTPLAPFTPPLPRLRPGCSPPPSMKIVAPAAPECEPVGTISAKRPALKPPVRGELDYRHLQPGRAVVCLLDSAWWPATVQSYCPGTGMAKVFWERQDWNAYPTVVDARRLRPRAAATGPTQPLQPRVSGAGRTVGMYPQRVQPVQRHAEETANSSVFIAQELQQLDATLSSVRDAARRAFEEGADGVTLSLQADCDCDVDACVVTIPPVKEGGIVNPVTSHGASRDVTVVNRTVSTPKWRPNGDPAI